MNPSEVLAQHAGCAESNTFGLSPDRRVSTVTLSSSLTVAMGQHAGSAEPIRAVRYGDILKLCLVHNEVYASLYSYDRDTNILRAFCESICPSTNMLHTMAGELTISLWHLYKISSLSISGRIYDEAMPDIHTWRAHTDKGIRRILKACESLLAADQQIVQRLESKKGVFAQQWVNVWCKRSISYSVLMKKKRYTDGPLMSTHNPTGKLADQLPEWVLVLRLDGSMSRVCAPCLSLNWHKLKTVKFYDWWTMVTIKDLRHNIDKLCSAVKSSSSNPKRVSRHDEARDARRSTKGHASQHEGTGNNVCVAYSKGLHLTGAMDDVEDEDKRTSDADFEMGVSFNIDDVMIEEAIEPLNVLTERTAHHSVDEPSTFKINAKTLGIPLDAKGIPRAPSLGNAVAAPSISTIRVTSASQGIFTSAIKILKNEYLTLLKQTPFDMCKADEYVWAVKDHLALKASLSNRLLTKRKGLEEESAALKKKEDDLLKELEDLRQRMDQVTNDLDVVPVCSTEEMEIFEEQEKKL
ncbi:Heat stress transcription factor A-1a [Bienertia sinuspersici]